MGLIRAILGGLFLLPFRGPTPAKADVPIWVVADQIVRDHERELRAAAGDIVPLPRHRRRR